MSDEFAEADDEYGLVMPFLPVESRGGPYEDSAYVAGWEMGRTDAILAAAAALGLTPDTGLVINHENRAQVDLVAMHHGFMATYEPLDEGQWGRVEFTKPIPTEEDQA